MCGGLDIPCSVSVGENMLRFIYIGELDPKVLENEEVNIIIYKYTQYSYSIK